MKSTQALGAGGMGEVYRAKDTHLDRHVAIEVLPAAMASDTDRLARFQREAESSRRSTIRASRRLRPRKDAGLHRAARESN